MSAPSDAQLIAASVADPSRFAQIFDRHAPSVQGYLRRRTTPGAADDLLSATFLTAFEKRDRFDTAFGQDARPWLLGIATNHLHAHHRAETRGRGIVERVSHQLDRSPHGDESDAVARRVDAEREAGALEPVLAGLAEGDRDVLLLFAWEDLTYLEIAHALAIPVGTVRSRLNRARRLLRLALAAPHDEEVG